MVDTSLVKLLAEYNRPDDIRVLLGGPHDVVLQEVEQALLDAGMYELLAGIWLEKREDAKVLDLWTRCVREPDSPSGEADKRPLSSSGSSTENTRIRASRTAFGASLTSRGRQRMRASRRSLACGWSTTMWDSLSR